MKYDPNIHHRRSIRLKGYDYTRPGAYYVTIDVHGRQCILGEIVNQEVKLSRFGKIVQQAWLDLPRHYLHVRLDAFCVMPEHVHGIIILVEDMVANASPRHGLPEIVRAFKTFSAQRINQLRHTPGIPVWQRNYYEHIIRNEEEWKLIWDYIRENPVGWEP